MLQKVAIIGPESTGKSTLCERLAQHYNALWCPEYAREYLLVHGMKYTYDDLLTIAKGQVEQEERYIQLASDNGQPGAGDMSHSLLHTHPSLLFIDTNMYVMKVWSDFVFGDRHPFILEQIDKRKYDLYLLCNVDLPWIADELREYPDFETRQRLYEIYYDIMMRQSVPWIEISGDSDQRFRIAIEAVDSLLK